MCLQYTDPTFIFLSKSLFHYKATYCTLKGVGYVLYKRSGIYCKKGHFVLYKVKFLYGILNYMESFMYVSSVSLIPYNMSVMYFRKCQI